MRNIEVYDDKTKLIEAATARVAELAQLAIQHHGRFTVALSGGSTPKPLYEKLASPPFSEKIDWRNVHIFWGDERTVPPQHSDSNYRMVTKALLDHVPISSDNIHRILGEEDPSIAAQKYEETLKSVFGSESLPIFDLILLGMGNDAHTASLFPETPAIHEMERWVVANHVQKLDTWRITLTPPVISAAQHVIFLVSGVSKATALHRVLNDPFTPDLLPSQIVQPTSGNLWWMVDKAALAVN